MFTSAFESARHSDIRLTLLDPDRKCRVLELVATLLHGRQDVALGQAVQGVLNRAVGYTR